MIDYKSLVGAIELVFSRVVIVKDIFVREVVELMKLLSTHLIILRENLALIGLNA